MKKTTALWLSLVCCTALLVCTVPLLGQTNQGYMAFQGDAQYFDGLSSMGPYAWVAPNQVQARRAVIGGFEGSNALWVCRGFFPAQNAWHPGKYYSGNCNVGWGTSEVPVPPSQGVQILVNNLQASFAAQLDMFPQIWAAPSATVTGFVGGTVGGVNMRVCRGAYNNSVYSGKEWSGACHIGWGGKDVPVTPYEVLSLYNGVKLAAAITKQINSIGANDRVISTIELVTVVPYPGSFTGLSLQMPPGFSIASSGVDNSSCPNTPASSCKQRWAWNINPGNNCRLNGNYSAVYQKGCAGGAACGVGTQVVNFSLQSENFCSETTVTTTSQP